MGSLLSGVLRGFLFAVLLCASACAVSAFGPIAGLALFLLAIAVVSNK